VAEVITLIILLALIPVMGYLEERKRRQKDSLEVERLRRMQ